MGVACLPSDGCWRHGGGWDCCWGDSTEGDGPAKWWAKSINEGNGHPCGGFLFKIAWYPVSTNRTQWVFTVDHVICKKNILQASCHFGPLFWINPLIGIARFTPLIEKDSNLRIYLRMLPIPGLTVTSRIITLWMLRNPCVNFRFHDCIVGRASEDM